MRRRSGDVVEVLVVNALRRSRFRSVAQLAPHESGIIASLTAFVVCCLLLFRFSVFFFFASSWCSCHRTCTSGKKLFLDRIASTVLVDVPPFQMKLNVSRLRTTLRGSQFLFSSRFSRSLFRYFEAEIRS